MYLVADTLGEQGEALAVTDLGCLRVAKRERGRRKSREFRGAAVARRRDRLARGEPPSRRHHGGEQGAVAGRCRLVTQGDDVAGLPAEDLLGARGG